MSYCRRDREPGRKFSLLTVPLLLIACADTGRDLSACQGLRRNHEQIADIEISLEKLNSGPPSEKRDQRKASLEKRRRMYLADIDRQQRDCHPIGKERPSTEAPTRRY